MHVKKYGVISTHTDIATVEVSIRCSESIHRICSLLSASLYNINSRKAF